MARSCLSKMCEFLTMFRITIPIVISMPTGDGWQICVTKKIVGNVC